MPVNDSPLDLPDQEPDNGSDIGISISSTNCLGSSNGADQNQDDSASTATEDTAAYTDADVEEIVEELQELLVSGLLYHADGENAGVEIRRGMTIRTTEGEVAGVVAGVINNIDPQQMKYILLSRPSQQTEYRMVPIELIEQVSDETVSLHILAGLVNTLAPWHR